MLELYFSSKLFLKELIISDSISFLDARISEKFLSSQKDSFW